MKSCRSCSHPAVKNRTECNRCRYIRRIKEDPVKISYWRLKGSATKRGKKFTLTLEEFRNFCIRTDYINKKGISGNAFHVDRIIEEEGYTADNIQALENIENVKKYKKWVDNNEYGQPIFTTVTVSNKIPVTNDCPF